MIGSPINKNNMVEKNGQSFLIFPQGWACTHLRVSNLNISHTLSGNSNMYAYPGFYRKNIHPGHFTGIYGVPNSSLNRDLLNIYPLLQCGNLAHIQKRVEVGEISPGKVREIVKLKVQMKENCRPTYLNEDGESLVIASAEIEGGHGLPFYYHCVAYQ